LINREGIADILQEITDAKSCQPIKNLLQTTPASHPDDLTYLELSCPNRSLIRTGPIVITDPVPLHSVSQSADNPPSLGRLDTAEDFAGSDSLNLDKNNGFPRHLMEPLGIIEASAKEAESLAATYWHAEDFANAELAYLDAISHYSYLLGYNDLHVCRLRSSLADTQAHLHRLDESISIRRQIIAACWLKYGENAHETLVYREKLASNFALQKLDEEAHFLYSKAADGYQKNPQARVAIEMFDANYTAFSG
jgi:hypothetical protein